MINSFWNRVLVKTPYLTPWIGAVGKFETDLNYNLRLPPTWKKTLLGNVGFWNIILLSQIWWLYFFCCLTLFFCISFVVRPVDEDASNPFPWAPSITQAKLMSPEDYQSPRQTFYKRFSVATNNLKYKYKYKCKYE